MLPTKVLTSVGRFARIDSRFKKSRAAKRGGFKRGGFPIWTCPSFFVLSCPFLSFPDFSGIFPICSGMVLGFSRFVPFLFLGLLRAPTRNSPERVRDTIWTFPEKSGKPPSLEPPRFSFSQKKTFFLCESTFQKWIAARKGRESSEFQCESERRRDSRESGQVLQK